MLYLLAFVAFVGAAFEIMPAGVATQKAFLIFILLLGLINARFVYQAKSTILYILPFVVYLTYCAISAYSISGSLAYVSSLVIPLLIGPIFYLYLSAHGDSFQASKLKTLFVSICIVQILFSFIKFQVHGIDEKVLIGTMSHSAGQLGFLFPTFAIPVLFFFYKDKNNLLLWSLVFGLALFGLINEKRSIVFLLPITVFLSIKANSTSSSSRLSARKLAAYAVAVLLGLSTILIGVSVIPSLSGSSLQYGGNSFFAPIEYALDYLTMDYGGNLQGTYEEALLDENVQVGRFTLIVSVFQWFSGASFWVKLFGLGFGVATPSAWIGASSDPLFDILGTRGATSGAILTIIETGFVGFALINTFFIAVYRSLRIGIRESSQAGHVLLHRWYKTLEVLFYLSLYDFFFYSITLFRTLPAPMILFGLLSTITILRHKKTAWN